MIVDVSKVRYDLVNPDKSSHSREYLNDTLKAVPNRSSFDSFVKGLRLNTNNKITFVVKRMNAKFKKKNFDEIKSIFLLNK